VILVFLLYFDHRYFVWTFSLFKRIFEWARIEVVPTDIDACFLVDVEADFISFEVDSCLEANHALEPLRNVLDFPEFIIDERIRIVHHIIGREPVGVLIGDFEHACIHAVLQLVLGHDLPVHLCGRPPQGAEGCAVLLKRVVH